MPRVLLRSCGSRLLGLGLLLIEDEGRCLVFFSLRMKGGGAEVSLCRGEVGGQVVFSKSWPSPCWCGGRLLDCGGVVEVEVPMGAAVLWKSQLWFSRSRSCRRCRGWLSLCRRRCRCGRFHRSFSSLLHSEGQLRGVVVLQWNSRRLPFA